MAKKNNNLLGVGGGRNTVSRSALRGGSPGGPGGPGAGARERERELLRKFREKSAAAHEDGDGGDEERR